jgi:hypothetical protein
MLCVSWNNKSVLITLSCIKRVRKIFNSSESPYFPAVLRKSVNDFVYYNAYFCLLSEDSALLFDVEEKTSSFCLKVSYPKNQLTRKKRPSPIIDDNHT